MKNLEDIFETDEFKALPLSKRIWFRIKGAFITFISYM
jgi:hypothetical protein